MAVEENYISFPVVNEILLLHPLVDSGHIIPVVRTARHRTIHEKGGSGSKALLQVLPW